MESHSKDSVQQGAVENEVQMRRQSVAWDKIFTSCPHAGVIMSKIYKKLNQTKQSS